MTGRKKIVFVDDEANFRASLRRLLHGFEAEWEMCFLERAADALEELASRGADVLVSDVRMPGMDGFALLSAVKEDPRTRDVPVIILTGSADLEAKRQALNLGAADLLNKPVVFEDLTARICNTLQIKRYQDELKSQNQILERRVAERTAELERSRKEILWRLAKAGEYRDEETGNHVGRVGCYSRTVAAVLGLEAKVQELIFLTSPLHDIGKIGIPDSILLKPGKLDPAEWEQMKRHCVIGAQILRQEPMSRRAFDRVHNLGGEGPSDEPSNPLVDTATAIAMGHHEKWNGAGYPNGLSGEAIPLEARIVAIADVFDALRSERPYKPAFSEEKTLSILREGSGSHFDPKVVDAFLSALESIRAIQEELRD